MSVITGSDSLCIVDEAYFPEDSMMFPPQREEALSPAMRRFFELREDLLLGYGYNTARAYWGDLESWFEWANEKGKDVMTLTDKDVVNYCARMRRRKYSENTIRRHKTSLRLLYGHAAAN